MPILPSLNILKQQHKSRTMRHITNEIIKDVENGQYLATSLGKFKKVFGELTINIISVGEISGTLSDNLDHLATSLKKRQALRRKLIGAAVYPIFTIFATLAITIMLTVFVFPRIIPVFKSINYELPWSTRFLILINNIFKDYGLSIFVGLIIVFIGFWLLLKIKKVRLWYHKALLYIPLIGQIIRTYNAANMCRTVGILLGSGVTVVRTFEIAAETTTNLAYKNSLLVISQELTKGKKISNYLQKNTRLFPVIMAQMLIVGESTGKLSETFLYLSDIFEDEMDETTKNLSTTVEPILLIFMGILVGFIAISIITPIYGITQHLAPK